jgi:protein-S-isoprenylcysteine O-methyltransferase Ste14
MAWIAALQLAYALAAYLFFLATFAGTFAFLLNLPGLPTTIDHGPRSPWGEAVAVDLALLGLFAVQHTVMARRGFKRWWTRIVPPPVERATFVLAASAVLALLLWQWRPIGEPVLWSVEHPVGRLALHAVGAVGWVVLGVSTWLIDHFELFGLQQPWAALRVQPAAPSEFRTPSLYKFVRHPLYLGFLLAFWGTPRMTAGHALFAAASTAYILMGVWFEERDLIAQFGERYVAYRQRVGMLLPRIGGRGRRGPAES